jgi:vacuolar-type H+-ATPase subunit I/STV1
MIDDSKKPLLFTVIVAGIAGAVSVPLSFIVGVVVTIAFGTVHETVGSAGVGLGWMAGIATTVIFVLYISYATYSFNKAKYVDGTVE